MSQAMADRPEDPPPAPRRRPFREVALVSGLVTAADLDAAEAEAGRRPADSPATPERCDRNVADVLVEQRRLTPFQARELLAGRTRFRLGQYTVIDEIGRGGMGQVFKAEHALMGRHVAVKVLPRAKATPESEAAFRREMRILGRLDHENVVRAFDAGYDAQVYYLVTEFVPGVDLRQQVRKHGPLEAVAAASVFTQVARALAFAHAHGLVHRDVKPGNILVMDDGRVKLLDLGLAGSTLETEALQLGNRVVGTMDYIAPEQIRSAENVGPPADIYALGCSMYFALTGEVPFPGGSRNDKIRRHLVETPVPLHRLAPHVPEQLCQAVEAMMTKTVADRIGSAAEVIQRLSRWAPDRPLPLPRSKFEEQHPDPERSDPEDPEGSAVDSWAGFGESGRQRPPRRPAAWADESWWNARRVAGAAARVLVPAVLAGLGFALALHLARSIDPDEFKARLGGITPSTCGWVAFVIMAAAQLAAVLGGRHR